MTTSVSSSVDQLQDIEDLVTQILLLLPVKSLMRFKCVSKPWLFTISSPQFCNAHTRRNPHPPPSGIIFYRRLIPCFLPLNSKQPAPLPSFALPDLRTHSLNLLQSCNGLMLCSYLSHPDAHFLSHYVCNPSTGQFRLIPQPGSHKHWVPISLNLAYDPITLPQYRLVSVAWCVPDEVTSTINRYQIFTYSSTSCVWKLSGDPFTRTLSFKDFKNGVLWRGALHWVIGHEQDKCVSFDLEKECLKEMSFPVLSGDERIEYFGEAGGRLLAIRGRKNGLQFDVLEMEVSYSNWVLKYRADVRDKVSVECSIENYILELRLDAMVECGCRFFTVIKYEDDEVLVVVISVAGKILSYNLKDGSWKFLESDSLDRFGMDRYLNGYQFIETLSPV